MENEHNQLSILIIEDDNDHADIIEFYIKEYSDDVLVNRLDDGEKAMQYIQRDGTDFSMVPHLIFLDLKLPKFDGHEILQKIKNNSSLKQIPVIIFTSSNSHVDVEKAFNNHANSYIVKPIDPGRFKEVIWLIISYWKSNERIKGIRGWEKQI